MSLAGLLQVAEGSPLERARLADVQVETLELLLGGRPQEAPLSPTLRLAAVRAAIDRLHVWCPQLREAEKVAARHALRLAYAGLELGGMASAMGSTDIECPSEGSWDTFMNGRGWDQETKERTLQALLIKRELLGQVALLEREAARHDDRLNQRDTGGAIQGADTRADPPPRAAAPHSSQ